ncbi:MAG: SURF1 family protein [Ilumatobacteraceae bacterium]
MVDRSSLFHPRWIVFHLIVIALVVVMVNLSLWQFDRMHQRAQFNSTVRARADQPVGALSAVLTPSTPPSAVDWRKVSVTGAYLPGDVEVVNLSQGGAGGRDVVSALRIADDGGVLLVNRGFVPSDRPTPPAPGGTVHLVGELRQSEVRGLGQPSDPGGVVLREVSRVDVPKLAPQFGGHVLPMYLELATSDPPEIAVPVDPPVLEAGPHLSYAIQWLLFSGGAVVGWVVLVRRRERPLRRRRPTS